MMSDWPIPGFTSTGSKRPEALFGPGAVEAGAPVRMARASGARVWDVEGREYLDFVMALGAVALGYAHPEVTSAATAAVANGVVGPLAPALEVEVGDTLRHLMPWIEQVRFLKTGAEACAAAVRLARLHTGRDYVLGCGYHGWLDWCQGGGEAGVPAATRALYGEIPFNDVEAARRLIRAAGDELACVVTEPIVVAEPTAEWLDTLRSETARVGALLVVDEVKTVCRIAVGGGTERYRLRPDLVVLGKAIANGFPLAAVGGRRDVMTGVSHTWISSTLSTEFVSLAAAKATLAVVERERVPLHLAAMGGRLLTGLRALHHRHPDLVAGAAGIAEMCFLQVTAESHAQAVALQCAKRGVLFKRSAYNFVSLAHDAQDIDRALAILDEVLAEARCSPK